MQENICVQGHVIDNGLINCSRCNSPAIGTVDVIPEVIEKSIPKEVKKEKVVKEKKVKKEKKEVKKVVKKKK